MRAVVAVIPAKAGTQGLNRIACGDAVNGFDAARRAAAGYFLLLAQEKVTKEKGNPEPPTPPALLAEAGARPTAHPCAAAGFALPARTALTRGLIRLRLRCSAAATGPNVKSNTGHRKAGHRSWMGG